MRRRRRAGLCAGRCTARAIGRSLRIYHAAGRDAVLDRFYARFLRPGDLAFDVGAHVGDRTASFLRLGARVVAVEPQPRLHRLLRLLFRRAAGLVLVPALVGAAPGAATLRLNSRNPTVATASTAFIAAAQGAPGWEGQEWDATLDRPVTTLDRLVAQYGRPAFIKLDIEGFEAEALAGLGQPVPALSFEFTTIQRDVALACLARLAALGYREFNACLGEGMAFAHAGAIGQQAMADWLTALPAEANSGDIYAALAPTTLTAAG